MLRTETSWILETVKETDEGVLDVPTVRLELGKGALGVGRTSGGEEASCVEKMVTVGQAAGGVPLQALQMMAVYVTFAAKAGTELMQGGAEITLVKAGGTTT